MKSMPKWIRGTTLALTLATTTARAAALTPAEIARIESDLEITLDAATASDLAAIVKPDAPDTWHTNALAQIDQHRKADMALTVRDRWGHPLPSAQVDVRLKHKKFRFGGVLSRFRFNTPSSSIDRRYQRLALKFFDASGLNNGLKLKLNASGSHLSQFFEWNQTNGISARGHLLIWPGTGGGSHLPKNVRDIIQDIYATAVTNADGSVTYDEQLKADLRAASYDMVSNWASQWPVYEWDVYNEPFGNHEIQEILDDYGMAGTWFRLARTNAVYSNCGLFINDNRMVSALSASQYNYRTGIYKGYIDELVASNAPITGIGFQARFRFDYASQGGPQLVTDRLNDFGNRYGLAMAGTEFHLPATTGGFAPSDQRRAEMTEEIMTAFFAHPLVTGLNAWTFQAGDPDQGPLLNDDWSVPLNGLVWHYLNRIKYATKTNLLSAANGHAEVRAFKGEYEILVHSGTNDYATGLNLAAAMNETIYTDLPSPDSDGDGLPDAYENLFAGLSPTDPSDAGSDPDGDGLSTRCEYAQGTNPFDAAGGRTNAPSLVASGPTSVTLSFARREGMEDQKLVFRFYRNDDLSATNAWTLFDPAAPDAGYVLESASTNEITDAYGRIFRHVYRLHVPNRVGFFRLTLESAP